MKILIIRFSSIGDIVLTTPVIRCLRKKFPESKIHFITKPVYAEILLSNSYVDKVHLLKSEFEETTLELYKENFDYIIDLHNNVRSLKIKNALKKAKSYTFKKLNIQKWILTNFKVNVLPPIHIVDRYMQTLKPLGVIYDGQGLDYFIPEKDKTKTEDIPASHAYGFIAVVIGAAHNTKKLPVQKLTELCSKINYPLILLGSEDDKAAGSIIAAQDDIKIYNACGKFNLNESADLIKRSKLVITHDTGLMHIAAAFKKQILSVWGNTVPAFGMFPFQTEYEVFEVNKLWCRPCSKIGYDKCPLGHFKCMNNIDIDGIVHSVNTLLKR